MCLIGAICVSYRDNMCVSYRNNMRVIYEQYVFDIIGTICVSYRCVPYRDDMCVSDRDNMVSYRNSICVVK